MAENLNEALAPATNQWGTISFEIPDFLKDAREAVNDVAELLITILEIVNLALEFVKAFLKAFLDPISFLLELIIEEIRALLRDLQQIGIYITGDWALLGWPPEDLRGGFQAYERRMIARLADRTDPTRPDVSGRMTVLGFFGYLSVDASEFERLVNLILGILRLFGLTYLQDTSGLPIPNILDVKYGAETANVFNFGSMLDTLGSFDGTPPQKARVIWNTQPASAKHPLNPFPLIGPSGFIVTVSALKDGIPLKFGRPRGDTDMKEGAAGEQVQPREYGNVLDGNGKPIVLHGGAEMLAFRGSPFEYNKNIDQGKEAPRDGGTQVWGIIDPARNEIIPLEMLGDASKLGTPGDKKGGSFFYQRTFLIESSTALAHWFAGEYSAVFDIEDMPRVPASSHVVEGTHVFLTEEGEEVTSNYDFNKAANIGSRRASTYYVRVWSAAKNVASEGKVPQWDFKADGVAPQQFKSGQLFRVDLKSGSKSIGFPSQPRKIVFANAHTKDYLDALQTALLVLVLSRSDLPLLDEIEATKTPDTVAAYKEGKWFGTGFAVKRTGLEGSKGLIGHIFPDRESMASSGQDPRQFAAKLYDRIRQVALDIYERTGPMPQIEEYVVKNTDGLRRVTWKELLHNHFGKLNAAVPGGLFGADEPLPLFEALNPKSSDFRSPEWGVAPNIWSMGIAVQDADDLFTISDLLAREPAFTVWNAEVVPITTELADPAAVQALLDKCPLGFRHIYRKFISPDGSLKVPTEWAQYLQSVDNAKRGNGSADKSPLVYVNRTQVQNLTVGEPAGALKGNLVFCRNLFEIEVNQGGSPRTLYDQARLVLDMAAGAFDRPPEDGEWIAIRLFDAFPDLEDFLASILNWLKAVQEAIKSIVDAIIKYIEFVQAQIVELQQLIRRINAMIQSLLSFTFALPAFSGLMLVSNGTDGVMADLVAAQNKPSDSPLAYGGGVALVVPLAPTFLLDLIFLLGDDEGGGDETTVKRPPDAIGVEKLPASAGAAPTDEPDVL